MSYTECPCHDCSILRDTIEGLCYNCICDMTPLLEVCNVDCPNYSICDAVNNPHLYGENK